jgi:hypothetical protein
MIKQEDLIAIEGFSNQWIDELGNLYVGREGQSLSSLIDELNTPVEANPKTTILPSITLWERLTEAEADQVNEAMATQPVRTQRIFTTANTFRSDHDLWPLLEQMATELFGAERAAQLLMEAQF